jgi:hypothetical protein
MGSKLGRLSGAVMLVLACSALPVSARPPCTMQNAQGFCNQDCQLLGHGGCASYGLDFEGGCYFDYTCTDGAHFHWACSCGSGCFLAGTKITMADGTVKPIESIAAGDVILAYDEASGELKPDEVKAVHDPVEWSYYLVVNDRIRLTPTHPVLSDGKWIEIGKLEPGATLTGPDGKAIVIESIKTVEQPVTVYNFSVNPYQTYVADGVIVHNKPPIPTVVPSDP